MKEKIINALKEISDPEMDISIWDLGLIYEVTFKKGKAVIKMTLTTPGCPFMLKLTDQVKEKISKLEEIKEVEVELVFDPPWSPERMSEEGRKKLGF